MLIESYQNCPITYHRRMIDWQYTAVILAEILQPNQTATDLQGVKTLLIRVVRIKMRRYPFQYLFSYHPFLQFHLLIRGNSFHRLQTLCLPTQAKSPPLRE